MTAEDLQSKYNEAVKEIKDEYDKILHTLVCSGIDPKRAQKDALIMQIESYRFLLEGM